jgi:hypothetical protein
LIRLLLAVEEQQMELLHSEKEAQDAHRAGAPAETEQMHSSAQAASSR